MTEGSQLLGKVLEIVEVMGEMRQQLASFIEKCGEKDVDAAKAMDKIQQRISCIELEGSKIVRELLKEEAGKIDEHSKAVGELGKSVSQLKTDIEQIKNDKKILSWKTGVVISFISIVITLFLTYIANHFIQNFM